MQARLRRSVACLVGGTVLAAVIAVALLAPVLATHDPIANNLADRLQPPSRAHLFGTDDFGRDVWSRVVWGARVSLVVALIVVGVSAVGAPAWVWCPDISAAASTSSPCAWST